MNTWYANESQCIETKRCIEGKRDIHGNGNLQQDTCNMYACIVNYALIC